MIYLKLTKAINGQLLREELALAGIDSEVTVYSYNGNSEVQLNMASESQKELAESILDSHNPPEPKQPTVAEKLALVGLSVDDLKAALDL